jgi:hypothetical protein
MCAVDACALHGLAVTTLAWRWLLWVDMGLAGKVNRLTSRQPMLKIDTADGRRPSGGCSARCAKPGTFGAFAHVGME